MIYKIETDDRDEAEILFGATTMYLTLCDLREHLRSRLKWADLGEEAVKELEAVNSLLFESLARSDIASKIG
jgi:hypothetical protein